LLATNEEADAFELSSSGGGGLAVRSPPSKKKKPDSRGIEGKWKRIKKEGLNQGVMGKEKKDTALPRSGGKGEKNLGESKVMGGIELRGSAGKGKEKEPWKP